MKHAITSCTPCPLRSACIRPCRAVERLLPKDETGRIGSLQRRHAQLYGVRLEIRRRYVRWLLDGSHVLRGRMKRAFDLRYTEGLTMAEIDARMGMSEGAAKIYVRRARNKIHRASRPGR